MHGRETFRRLLEKNFIHKDYGVVGEKGLKSTGGRTEHWKPQEADSKFKLLERGESGESLPASLKLLLEIASEAISVKLH